MASGVGKMFSLVIDLVFLTVPWVCLQCVIVVFPDHTHLLLIFLFIFGVLQEYLVLAESRLLRPVQGGVRDVAHSINAHEQT